ncbi:efflux RND transporter periplasmic adaptor subunit [bacterium]|nr:MAG: efflux RND transporter periplasmic adaptor subunit [bacterium]
MTGKDRRAGWRILASVVITAALIAVISGCSGDKSGNAEKQQGQQLIAVVTEAAISKSVDRSVEAIGTLFASDEVTVSNEISGTMEKMQADLGDKVKVGDTLAILDQREAKLNLADADAAHVTNIKTVDKGRARAFDAKATFERYDGLFKQGMVSASQFDSAKMQYDVATAELKEYESRLEQSIAKQNLAKKRLADTVIKSPISGEVSKRFVSAGETVRERTPVFVVVATQTLKFRGTVPEVFVPQIKTGSEVSLYVEAFKDTIFKGKLSRISPAVSPETRTLEIEATVPNADGVLKPGYFARGLIRTLTADKAVFVPEQAVLSNAGVVKVFVIKDSTASERLVKTGARQADMIEINADVKEGDIVATTNLLNLFDGASVSVKQK